MDLTQLRAPNSSPTNTINRVLCNSETDIDWKGMETYLTAAAAAAANENRMSEGYAATKVSHLVR